MAYDGAAEMAAIMTRIGALAGGRVWEDSVPGDGSIVRNTDGSVKPHLIASFSTPFSSRRERGIAQTEKQQPHLLTFTLRAVAADPSTARLTLKAATDLLVDWAPSASATVCTLNGGFGFPSVEKDTAPIRFNRMAGLQLTLNLAS